MRWHLLTTLFWEVPLLWVHSSVPYLQLVSIVLQLENGSIYRMLSQSDDGSGHFGLFPVAQDLIDDPCKYEPGSIYRTRELSGFPVGTATVAVTEIDGPDAVLRMEIVIEGRAISLWAAEVYERDGGYFEIVGGDESIPVQVDRMRPF